MDDRCMSMSTDFDFWPENDTCLMFITLFNVAGQTSDKMLPKHPLFHFVILQSNKFTLSLLKLKVVVVVIGRRLLVVFSPGFGILPGLDEDVGPDVPKLYLRAHLVQKNPCPCPNSFQTQDFLQNVNKLLYIQTLTHCSLMCWCSHQECYQLLFKFL